MRRNYSQPVSSVEAIGTPGLLQLGLPSPVGKTGEGTGELDVQYAPAAKQYAPSQQYNK